jgi:flagellar hook-associated protein 3 FlgL
MNESQKAISTGKKLEKASDAPISFSRISHFKTAIYQNEQFLRSVAVANNWMDNSSISVQQIDSLIRDAKEFAQHGLDSMANADTRANLATSVSGIIEQAVDIGNTQYMGKNLFAGTLTKTGKPFEIVGDSVIYSGNADKIARSISETVSIDINITGQEIIDTGIFTALFDLRTALVNDDEDAIRSAYDTLNGLVDSVTTLKTSLDSMKNNVTLVQNRLEESNLYLSRYLADEENVDYEEEYVKFETEKMAYQAALQSASQVMNLNILNFLQ